LWSLKEEGATALGPALLTGIAVAGLNPSSQVCVLLSIYVCTVKKMT
jgi:hypothetical protein